MTYIDGLALLGGTLLGFCPLPQAIKTWRTKRAEDVSWWFLGMWGVGDVAMLLYGIEVGLPLPIVLNNVMNALCISVIAWYR